MHQAVENNSTELYKFINKINQAFFYDYLLKRNLEPVIDETVVNEFTDNFIN